MPNSLHQRAQELSSLAELARLKGDLGQARQLYRAAAELEGQSLDLLGLDKPRSRGILSVSYTALLVKAGLYERAEETARHLLENDLSPIFQEQLRELLHVIQNPELNG